VKAIIDRDRANHCKGYGFVMFEKDEAASAAITALLEKDMQVAFAKVRIIYFKSCLFFYTNLFFLLFFWGGGWGDKPPIDLSQPFTKPCDKSIYSMPFVDVETLY